MAPKAQSLNSPQSESIVSIRINVGPVFKGLCVGDWYSVWGNRSYPITIKLRTLILFLTTNILGNSACFPGLQNQTKTIESAITKINSTKTESLNSQSEWVKSVITSVCSTAVLNLSVFVYKMGLGQSFCLGMSHWSPSWKSARIQTLSSFRPQCQPEAVRLIFCSFSKWFRVSDDQERMLGS